MRDLKTKHICKEKYRKTDSNLRACIFLGHNTNLAVKILRVQKLLRKIELNCSEFYPSFIFNLIL